jgi:hypothetical protein
MCGFEFILRATKEGENVNERLGTRNTLSQGEGWQSGVLGREASGVKNNGQVNTDKVD